MLSMLFILVTYFYSAGCKQCIMENYFIFKDYNRYKMNFENSDICLLGSNNYAYNHKHIKYLICSVLFQRLFFKFFSQSTLSTLSCVLKIAVIYINRQYSSQCLVVFGFCISFSLLKRQLGVYTKVKYHDFLCNISMYIYLYCE